MSFEQSIKKFKHVIVMVGLAAGLLIPFNIVKAESKIAGFQYKYVVTLLIGAGLIVFFKFYLNQKEQKKVKKIHRPHYPPQYYGPPQRREPPIEETPIEEPIPKKTVFDEFDGFEKPGDEDGKTK